MEPHYELVNQRTRALVRAREQKPELEIREAGTNCGDVDHVDGDVKLASNNLDALMRRVSLTSTREIDSIILRAESFACKDSQRWNSDSRGTLAREYTDLKLPVLP